VGFSYSNDKRDYITNDTHTAQDAHKALRAFFTLHPQLQANRFFISGAHCRQGAGWVNRLGCISVCQIERPVCWDSPAVQRYGWWQ
jgi:hypothetical protein